jgi:hypothetical protein
MFGTTLPPGTISISFLGMPAGALAVKGNRAIKIVCNIQGLKLVQRWKKWIVKREFSLLKITP